MTHYYSSTAIDTTLSIGIGSADTSMTVQSTTGFPTSYPYTLAVGYDTSSEELVDVTNASGNVLTIIRAVDSTTAQSHAAASTVKHVICGRDLRESQTHIDSTSSVHGLTSSDGNIVGTDKTQTLTAKTLTSPAINGATLGGTTTNSGTISGGTITATTAATLATSRNINGVLFNGSADVTVPAAAGTLTGGTLASGVTASSLTSFGSGATINGATIDAASTIGGVSGTTLAADRTAWTSITPTITSGWTGTPLLRYKQIGKTVHFRYTYVVAAGGSTATDMTVTLPVAAVAPTSVRHIAFGEFTVGINTGNRWLLSAPIITSSGTSTFTIYHNNSTGGLTQLTPSTPSASAGNNTIVISGTYEAA
jgi:hypothetical protein